MKKTIALLMACALLAALAGCRNGTPAPGSSSSTTGAPSLASENPNVPQSDASGTA